MHCFAFFCGLDFCSFIVFGCRHSLTLYTLRTHCQLPNEVIVQMRPIVETASHDQLGVYVHVCKRQRPFNAYQVLHTAVMLLHTQQSLQLVAREQLSSSAMHLFF